MNQHPYPRVQHHGAVNGVTGSCHQLWMTPADSLLIDCGLFQGAETSGAGAGQAPGQAGGPQMGTVNMPNGQPMQVVFHGMNERGRKQSNRTKTNQ